MIRVDLGPPDTLVMRASVSGIVAAGAIEVRLKLGETDSSQVVVFYLVLNNKGRHTELLGQVCDFVLIDLLVTKPRT